MVFWVAAHLEPMLIAGTLPTVDAHGNICAPPKVDPEAPAVKVPKAEETSYWQSYQRLVQSRGTTGPFYAGPCVAGWGPGWPF